MSGLESCWDLLTLQMVQNAAARLENVTSVIGLKRYTLRAAKENRTKSKSLLEIVE